MSIKTSSHLKHMWLTSTTVLARIKAGQGCCLTGIGNGVFTDGARVKSNVLAKMRRDDQIEGGSMSMPVDITDKTLGLMTFAQRVKCFSVRTHTTPEFSEIPMIVIQERLGLAECSSCTRVKDADELYEKTNYEATCRDCRRKYHGVS